MPSHFKVLAREFRNMFLRRSLRKSSVELGGWTCFHNSKFEGWNRIGNRSVVNYTEFGMHTYVGTDCDIRDAKIGRYCSIADQVVVVQGAHPLHYVSTAPVFSSNRRQTLLSIAENFDFKEYQTVKGPDGKDRSVVIDSDVWIGSGAAIMGGVHIGVGAVIAARAVVTRNVAPYEIVAGVPARPVKKRFSDDVVQELLKTEWWEKPFGEIRTLAAFFNSPQVFLYEFNKRYTITKAGEQ